MLDISTVQAITLDLDDTLWPIWPTIARAEKQLLAWLQVHAPATATLAADPHSRVVLRAEVEARYPELAHDLGSLRREAIRLQLARAGDDTNLAEPAYDVFIAERMNVTLFEDVLPALEWLSARMPIVSVSNGNADVHQIGIGNFFAATGALARGLELRWISSKRVYSCANSDWPVTGQQITTFNITARQPPWRHAVSGVNGGYFHLVAI